MAEVLKLPDWELKLTMLSVLRGSNKVENMQDYMDNLGRETETLRKEMLERNTMREMKDDFDGLLSRLHTIKGILGQPEDKSPETFQSEKEREKEWERKGKNIQ